MTNRNYPAHTALDRAVALYLLTLASDDIICQHNMSMREKLNFAQKNCIASAGRLMLETGMLHPGARVGVAVSGGMDSFVLLKVLRERQRIVPFHFDLMALHVNPGFAPDNHWPLTDWLKVNGLAGHMEIADHGPKAHSEENRKRSTCFYCCTKRRQRLFELCRHYDLTHLAFGHNAEDLVGTFFMNMLRNGRVEGMVTGEIMFRGELKLIRPLLWLEKETIRKACAAWELPIWDNPCPSAGLTQRARTMQSLSALWAEDPGMRTNLFNALRHWQISQPICDRHTKIN